MRNLTAPMLRYLFTLFVTLYFVDEVFFYFPVSPLSIMYCNAIVNKLLSLHFYTIYTEYKHLKKCRYFMRP